MTSGSVLRFRIHAQHLDFRLPGASLAGAAAGGLQDSAPRSGLLSLHARCVDINPQSWQDPSLAQVWGPRMAVYLVPAEARAAFTLGRLPREPIAAQTILHLGATAAEVLADGPASTSEVEAAIGLRPPASLRSLGPSGRLAIRWDVRTTTVIALPPPQVDPEDARLELARRFLAWQGPATPGEYASWAGVEEADARITLAAVRPPDVEQMATLPPPTGVRLLPPGDPYLARDRRSLVQSSAQFEALFRPKGVLAGALLVDGRIEGTWNRQQRRVEVRPWSPVDRNRVAREVEAMGRPLGGPVRLAFA